MTVFGWVQIALAVALLGAAVVPLGGYMAKVFSGERTFAHPLLVPVERLAYRLAGVRADDEQPWRIYAACLLIFHALNIALLYAILSLQHWLPLNPQHMGPVKPDLAFNTAVSFVTNTSWQSYSGEQTLSHFSQMVGVAVASFLSAASGVSVAVALIRGFARRGAEGIGSYWVDMTRSVLYVLLPLSIVAALVLLASGVPQTLGAYVQAATLEGGRQVIAIGPVASQEAIKLLSGDGGGFFNVNSAHPFENPTPLTNLVEIVLMALVGAALTETFGRMVGDRRQGRLLLAVMAVLFAVGVTVVSAAEAHRNPGFAHVGILGPNMEGKEVRFGAAGSALFAQMATATADGAVNSMHDSFMPLSGAVLMANMKIGEVIFGAPGSGLFAILMFALLAVFISGLMIGRTPEYLGKKIEAREMQWTMLAALAAPLATLGLTAIAVTTPAGLAGAAATGPHGLSEILYAYTSAAATNGSAFAGLSANTPFYNLTLALGMVVGRFGMVIPILAIAGSLAAKRRVEATGGTMPTHDVLFGGLLIGVILIVGGLCYFPVLTLAPVLEHLSMPGRG